MRRKVELLLGAALAAGVPGTTARALADHPRTDAAPLNALGDSATPAFHPPLRPLVLTRELRREMPGGREFVSRRHYAIRFEREGAGWRIDGDLVSSEVEAPGVAPEMAELERSRKDTGLFPLHLDGNGLIVAQQGSRDEANARQTRLAAAAFLDRAGLAGTDRQAVLDAVARLQAQGRAAGGNWPADLFVSRSGAREEVRSIPLGDGLTGKVMIAIAAESDNGLVERFERRVTTDNGVSRRHSTEVWTIALAR